jgi:hypothetical protein
MDSMASMPQRPDPAKVSRYDEEIKIEPRSLPFRHVALSRAAFRSRLDDLLSEFLSRGGDAFWLHAELSQATAAIIDSLRCDLDVEHGEPPF